MTVCNNCGEEIELIGELWSHVLTGTPMCKRPIEFAEPAPSNPASNTANIATTLILNTAQQRQFEEALTVLAHVVSQANVNEVISEDESGPFVSRYDMPVGSIHKAIPFLARHGVVVDEFGAVHWSPTRYPDRVKPVAPVVDVTQEALPLDRLIANLETYAISHHDYPIAESSKALKKARKELKAAYRSVAAPSNQSGDKD